MAKKLNRDQAATKADIDRLEESLKDRLEDSLKKFVAKTDLKRTERVLRTEILRVEERVENVEDGLKRLEGKVDKMDSTIEKISNQLDGFVGRVSDLTNDNEIGADQIHELRKTAKDHEKRITKLETPN